MYVNGKFIAQLEPIDIIDLKENNIKENVNLDYKRRLDIVGEKDKNRREFIRDVTSFYNTGGGCIIYGIDELRDENNQPTGYPGDFFDNKIANEDKFEIQIRNIIKSNTDPCLDNITIKFLKVENCDIVIIGISKRIGFPCMVTFNGENNFYRRSQTEKYVVPLNELNKMFTQNYQVKERAFDFVDARIKEVLKGHLIPTLDLTDAVFLHVIPFAWDNDLSIDVRLLPRNEDKRLLNPMRNGFSGLLDAHYAQYNVDGYITSISNINNRVRSYMQVFRNGCIEYCGSIFTKEDKNQTLFFGHSFLVNITNTIWRSIRLYEQLHVEPPFLAFVNLTDTRGKTLTFYNNSDMIRNFTCWKISLPFVYISKKEYSEQELYSLLKQHFDVVWQAVDQPAAPEYPQVFSEKTRNDFHYNF